MINTSALGKAHADLKIQFDAKYADSCIAPYASLSGKQEIVDAGKTLAISCATNRLASLQLTVQLGAQPDSDAQDTIEKTQDSEITRAVKELLSAQTVDAVKSSSTAQTHTTTHSSQSPPQSSPQPKKSTSSANSSEPVAEGPVTIACKTKNLESVKKAIEDGHLPDAHTLFWAIKSLNADMVRYVISKGARPLKENKNRELNLAIFTKKLKIVHLVAVNAKVTPKISNLSCAIRIDHPEIINFILTSIEKLPENILTLYFESHKAKSKLSQAAAHRERFHRMVAKLIDRGARAEQKPEANLLNLGFRNFPADMDDQFVNTILRVGCKPLENTLDLAFTRLNCSSRSLYPLFNSLVLAGAKPTRSTLTKACRFRFKIGLPTDDFSDGTLIECVINAGALPDDKTFENIQWFSHNAKDKLYDSTIELLLQVGLATQANITNLEKRIKPLPKSKHKSSKDLNMQKEILNTQLKNEFYQNVIDKAKDYLKKT